MRDGRRRRGGPPNIFFGLVIVALGVIFFLDQQGIFPAHEAFRFFWGAIIIFWGVKIVVHAHGGSGQIWGALVIFVGATSVANELGLLHIHIASLWPLGLIAFGVWKLLDATGSIPPGPRPSEGQDWGEKVRSSFNPAEGQAPSEPAVPAAEVGDSEFNQTVILSAFKRRVTSQHFKYAKVGVVLGGFNIDLTGANMDGDRAVIHVDSVFGGGEIRVPDTWKVTLEAGAVGGAFVDETYPRPADASAPVKQLIVRGAVVFGGVIIKN
ncbi:MAG: DUF5668 domain-containing protein [Acidobacteriia bacterium]|nr:DUF5668 domain-containing protein [Terriglobia bacterium]